jgi:hypothetical protein
VGQLRKLSPDLSVIFRCLKNSLNIQQREYSSYYQKAMPVYRTDLMRDMAFVEENGKLVLKQ